MLRTTKYVQEPQVFALFLLVFDSHKTGTIFILFIYLLSIYFKSICTVVVLYMLLHTGEH